MGLNVNQNVGLNMDLTGDAEASKEMRQEERGAVIPVIYHHWRGLFFGLSQYLLSFIWLIALILLIAVTIYQFYRISPLAACLQIPYLLWCLFAAYLNLSIYLLNR